MPPALRIRPYKDFLTPLLHRRFMRAAGLLWLICYVEALLIGEINGWLWTWFIFGRAGIRTGLLFICGFSIFVLRVGQLHVGKRTTRSPFETFTKYAFRYDSLQTTFWYLFSGWLYSEVYRWSAPKTANIWWITESRNSEFPKLNERSIYLTVYFLLTSLAQAGIHLYYDYDRIDMPLAKLNSQISTDPTESPSPPPFVQVTIQSQYIALNSAKRALIGTLISPVIYALTVRHWAWSWSLWWAQVFWKLPRSSSLPLIGPYHVYVLWKSFSGGFLLIFLWELGNAAFSTYVAQEPLKNDRPITYESRDPNGSLLTGLRGKKLQTKAFAMWELLYISQVYNGRRKTIFEDIDRKGGSTWSQILEICLSTITGVDARITEYLTPAAAPVAVPMDDASGLPRMAAPIQEFQGGSIFRAPPSSKSMQAAIGNKVSEVAKSYGQSPTGPRPLKLINDAKSKLLSPAQQDKLSSGGLSTRTRGLSMQVLESPLGWPFRHTYRRRMAAIILGSPYGDVGIIVDAIECLTRLAVSSLVEDPYGNVSRDIPEIIRTYTAMIERLDGFDKVLQNHWTDIEKKRSSPEMETVSAALKKGLNDLLGAFGDYSVDLNISQTDMRMAREAATPPGPSRTEKQMKQR